MYGLCLLSRYVFFFYNLIFNFLDNFQVNIYKKYNVFKYVNFDKKVLKLGVYNSSISKYITLYDIDRLDKLVYYYIRSKVGYANNNILEYTDISAYTVEGNNLVVARLVKDNKIHNVITNKSVTDYFNTNLECWPIIYTTCNDTLDITHIVTQFLPSFYYNDNVSCRMYVDALCGFAGLKRCSEDGGYNFKCMLDNDSYDEKIFKEKDIIIFK